MSFLNTAWQFAREHVLGIPPDFPKQMERLRKRLQKESQAHPLLLLLVSCEDTQPKEHTLQLWAQGKLISTDHDFQKLIADVQKALHQKNLAFTFIANAQEGARFSYQPAHMRTLCDGAEFTMSENPKDCVLMAVLIRDHVVKQASNKNWDLLIVSSAGGILNVPLHVQRPESVTPAPRA
ncbi:MAG: hypothetical protein L6Q57_07620 [Alphaproteobacteria bacterium]|nr:hypothetical protein [Alphaproteobacteria bacterium]